MAITSFSSSVFDGNSLAALKSQVQSNSPQALKAAAQQFEALFLQMVLKSMRDASPQEGIFDSDQSRMYESLLDQQMTQVLATKGGGTGLAAQIEKQLSRSAVEPQQLGNLPLNPAQTALPLTSSAGVSFTLPKTSSFVAPTQLQQAPIPLTPLPTLVPANSAAVSATGSATPEGAAARAFVSRVWPYAQEASQATGIPAHFMIAQAALESGWGKSEPRFADGRPSYNIFGIKAGKSWNGPVVEAMTTEHVNGADQRQVEGFRAYASYGEAFRDYANLLTSNPRYANVVGSQNPVSFARGLQQAGYATDPLYAAKLERIIGGSLLRQGLMG